jgi:dienelactone hydrolase
MLSIAAVLVVTASVSAGCGDKGGDAPYAGADLLGMGPYPVGYSTMTLVDESRPTWGTTDASDLPSRTLVTEVVYPAEASGRDAAPAPGPFPLVLYSHGLMGGRENNLLLARLLASHGLVIAAPDFPRTHMGATGGIVFEDSRFQAGDVRFVIDALKGMSAAAGDRLHGLLEERVVLLGYSLGAYTNTLAGFHPAERHPAVVAVILLAPSGCYIPDNTFDEAEIPLMIIHGDKDAIIPWENGPEALFSAARGERWLLRLQNGTHTGFVDAMTDLLGGLAHADSVGCSAISGQIPDVVEIRSDYQAWWMGLGGMPLIEDCSDPCSDPSLLEVGMKPERQVEILDVATRAFLMYVLENDRRARRFLDRDLGAAYPDVTVQRAP